MVMYRTLFLPIRSASLPRGMAKTMDASADPVTIAPRMNSLAPLIWWAKTWVNGKTIPSGNWEMEAMTSHFFRCLPPLSTWEISFNRCGLLAARLHPLSVRQLRQDDDERADRDQETGKEQWPDAADG